MNQVRWIVVMLVVCGMLGTLTVLHRLHRPELANDDGNAVGTGPGQAIETSPDLFAGLPAESQGRSDLWAAQFELGPPAPHCTTVDDTSETTAAYNALLERFEVLREP
jgi:hypothetical protein